jgi:uncharacterized tellurite resistance protein B-like protein
MRSEGQLTLTTLHDLALLYLGLAHGADGALHDDETDAIAAKLRHWNPDKDPALIDHVIREASLSYLNGPSEERLKEAINTLGDVFPERLLRAILHDLNDIAEADGQVVAEERAFIGRIADAWDLEHDPGEARSA